MYNEDILRKAEESFGVVTEQVLSISSISLTSGGQVTMSGCWSVSGLEVSARVMDSVEIISGYKTGYWTVNS